MRGQLRGVLNDLEEVTSQCFETSSAFGDAADRAGDGAR